MIHILQEAEGKKHKDTSKVEENLIEENLKIIVWKNLCQKWVPVKQFDKLNKELNLRHSDGVSSGAQ